MDGYNDDDIVISGISGRYPACDNPQELQEKLFGGIDLTTTEHKKWLPGAMGVPNRVGAIKDIHKCDVQFFGIIRKHCNSLDPITRMILERTMEAIFDAGITPLELKGTNTGVFVNMAYLESEMVMVQSGEMEMHGIMGRNRALNANRISYWLDLKGPSYAVDCIFNGGLQCIQDAVSAIKLGVIDAAIVGSGAVILHPHTSYQFKQVQLLSQDGVTKSFDAEADGYGRGEAVTSMIIQRARDARKSYGTIVHVLNQSMCTTNSLILNPVQDNWRLLLEKFYNECKINPKDVGYIEADGASKLEMDAAELNAIGQIFCQGRTSENPLLVGSVKSNMGHTEAAANLCALSKLIIAMQTDTLPANLNYSTPNPRIGPLVRGAIKVVTESTPLESDLVALNSFGLGGTYGHLLLRRNPRTKTEFQFKEGDLPQILLASSRHDEGMDMVLSALESAEFDPNYANLVNNAFKGDIQGQMTRGFIVLPKQEPHIRSSQHYSGAKLPVWFVFAGMGCQWPTMARDLLAIPTFKKSIEISAKVLKAHGIDLMHLITHDDAALFDNILHSFVSIVSVQIALVDVLRELGVEPDGIIGHSVGETSASYADGCLTQEQTLLSAYYRGKVSLECNIIQGSMAAIGIGYQKMKQRVPEGIEIACHNGPDSCTLSGPTEKIIEFVEQLTAEGTFARAVNVSNIPYHSKYIQEMGPKMHDYLKHVITEGKPRSSRWISTSFPESRWGEPEAKICSAQYHINNLLSPVLFEEGCRHIPPNAITIEIAPHGLLQAILKRSMPTCVNIPLTNRNVKNQLHVFLKALGRLHENGVTPKVEVLYPKVTYPVPRGTGFLSHLVTWDHSDDWSDFSSTVMDTLDSSRSVVLPLDQEGCILKAHKQDGVAILPHSEYLLNVHKAYLLYRGGDKNNSMVEFNDVLYHAEPSISGERDFQCNVTIQPGNGAFEVVRLVDGKDELLVTGSIKLIETPELVPEAEFEPIQEVPKEEFYSELLHAGHGYDKELQTITKLLISENEWKASVEWDNDLGKLLDSMLQVKILHAAEIHSRIPKLRKIRKFVLDLNPEQHDIVLDLRTESIRCGQIEIRDADFDYVLRNPIKFNKEELNTPTLTLPPAPDTLQLSYLQFNGSEVEGRQLAYIGKEDNKKRVMGLAVADKVSSAINEDPILKWQIPAKWSLEEAVPVPLNYILAYHAVHNVGQFQSTACAVITDGTNKLGVACLRVALEVSSDVLTLVHTEEEKEQLLKFLPKLLPDNVLVMKRKEGDQICLKIKMSRPDGVDLIINTGVAELTQVSIKCIAPFAIMVEMSDELFETRGKLKNSYGFLISASLYSCSGNDVANSHDDNKKQILKLLDDGITSGVVVPFPENIKDWRHTKTISLDPSNKTTNNKRFQCDPLKSYLILGGDPYTWITIAEWFVQRKAKHIIVVHKEAAINNSLQKKLKELQEKCNIVVKTANTLSPELIDHIFSISRVKIALTMLMPMTLSEEPDERVVEALSKKDSFLVTVLRSDSPAAKYCEKRTSVGNSSLTVLWDEPLNGKTRSFLVAFDRLLNTTNNEIITVHRTDVDEESGVDLYEGLLPNSAEQALSNDKNQPKEVGLTELATKSRGFKHCKEITPLFVVPGLVGREDLIERLRDSIHPVFVVNIPPLLTADIHEFAACLIPKLKNVTEGPYVLIGENWGGAVALETARMLETMGDESQVFLLAAVPAELLKDRLTSLDELDVMLLTRVFGRDPEVIRKEQSWNERLNSSLADSPFAEDSNLGPRLNAIRERVATLLKLEAKEPLNGAITCIGRLNIPRNSLAWMCRQDIPLTIVRPTEPLLNDTTLSQIQEATLMKTKAR